ncbi:hypothetical protein NE237_023638 [Protea cynaroides]|uniref:Uncharacterized protein n=1 Tax=Protea cynaroides TaxID=273540 RepID=A0A9Q0HHE4_9MAGN|nr:hypothetical protein NE237_023638 [Protea cynaroides]
MVEFSAGSGELQELTGVYLPIMVLFMAVLRRIWVFQMSMASGGFEKVGELQRFLEGTFWNSYGSAWEVCESYLDACNIICGSQMVPSMEVSVGVLIMEGEPKEDLGLQQGGTQRRIKGCDSATHAAVFAGCWCACGDLWEFKVEKLQRLKNREWLCVGSRPRGLGKDFDGFEKPCIRKKRWCRTDRNLNELFCSKGEQWS